MKHHRLIYAIISLLLVGIVLIFFFRTHTKVAFGNLQIRDVNIQVEVADEPNERYKGLSYREHLCDLCGMLFVFEEPKIQIFWMRKMKFPLDLIFMRDNEIVEIVENLPHPKPGEDPRIYTSREEADQVLEVNAGFISQHKLRIGDPILLQKNTIQ